MTLNIFPIDLGHLTKRNELNKELDAVKENLKDIKHLGDLKQSTINRLQKQINQIDVNKAETNVTIVFDKITRFLISDAGAEKNSEIFYNRGVSFHLNLEIEKTNNNKKPLGVYLMINRPAHESWSINTTFTVSLLSRYNNHLVKSSQKFFESVTGYGWGTFIYIEDLALAEKGFIYNDTMKMQINLKTSKLNLN